jgi:hypothetical protein
MKNLPWIIKKLEDYESDLKVSYNGTIEDIELASVYAVVDELLEHIDATDETRYTIVNMYFAGKMRK